MLDQKQTALLRQTTKGTLGHKQFRGGSRKEMKALIQWHGARTGIKYLHSHGARIKKKKKEGKNKAHNFGSLRAKITTIRLRNLVEPNVARTRTKYFRIRDVTFGGFGAKFKKMIH